jgi:hypothetical protein
VIHAPNRAIGVDLDALAGRAFQAIGKNSGRRALKVHGGLPEGLLELGNHS